jgi:hypothetical protein
MSHYIQPGSAAPQQVFVSLPTNAFDPDDFDGSVLEIEAALSVLKDASITSVLRDLGLFLDELGIFPMVVRRPELYGHPTAAYRLHRKAPEAALHIALGEAHRLKYLKRFWNVFCPTMGRSKESLKAAHSFFQECHCVYANITGYLGGHLPLHALRPQIFGQPIGILPRVEHIRLARRAHVASGRVDSCQIIPCYINTYSASHAVYVASQHLSSSWELGAQLAERMHSCLKLVTVVDPLADVPTALAKALVEIAHLDLIGEPFLLFVILEGATRWEEQQALALQERLASTLVGFAEGHHVLSPGNTFLVFPPSRIQLANFLCEMDVLLGLELGFLDSPINQLALAVGLRLLSMDGDGVAELLPRIVQASHSVIDYESRVWFLSEHAGQWRPTEFRLPAPGALRMALAATRRNEWHNSSVQQRRDSFSTSISDLGNFFRGFAKVRAMR